MIPKASDDSSVVQIFVLYLNHLDFHTDFLITSVWAHAIRNRSTWKKMSKQVWSLLAKENKGLKQN